MYVLVDNGVVKKYPYSLGDLRVDLPQVSFPESKDEALLNSFGIYKIVDSGAVFDEKTQVAEQTGVELLDGIWTVAWSVRDKTQEELYKDALAIKKVVTDATSKRLDDFAKTRNYDSILSACTYATSTVAQFASEGQLCVNLRDATWAKLYQIMQEVETGVRPMPSGYADIESELPELTWGAL